MPTQPPPSASLKITLGLAALILILGLVPSWSVPALEFNRSSITDGQWWRLITGHWVHYGLYHLAMNASAFVLCGYILLRGLPAHHYVLLLCTCLLGVGGGLYWLSPQPHTYAGLSGALHGLITAGLILRYPQAPWLSSAALVLLVGKLAHEQSAHFDPYHPLLLAPVAVNAHCYGAVIGTIFGLIALAQRQRKNGSHT